MKGWKDLSTLVSFFCISLLASACSSDAPESNESAMQRIRIEIGAGGYDKQAIGGLTDWTKASEFNLFNDTMTPEAIAAATVVQINPEGDAADVVEIALATTDDYTGEVTVWLTGTQTTEINGQTHFQLKTIQENLIIFEQNLRTLSVLVKFAVPVSSKEAGGAWHGFARSGHLNQFNLDSITLAGDPPGFVQKSSEMRKPPVVILRKGQPVFKDTNSVPLGNLVEGKVTLYSLTVEARGGSIFQKQLPFRIAKEGEFNLSDFTISREGIEMDPADYVIFPADGSDAIPPGVLDTELTVRFSKEEAIGSNPVAYTIHANAQGVTSGCRISAKLILPYDGPGSPEPILTGMLKSDEAVPHPRIFVGGDTIGKNLLVWSDGSEGTDHNSALNGSIDWTNGRLVLKSTGWQGLKAP